MPQVSVIIPNYNHAPYLVQRIDSVLNQTFQDFEVIILDDCSPDNSREIIEQYRSHPKVVHIEYNTKNSGSTFKQWKKGIDLAQGEYIWIAESDDWAEESFLEVMMKGITDDSNMIFCHSHIIYGDKKEKWLNEVGGKIVHDSTNFTANKMLANSSIYNASMVLFRKKALLQVNFESIENLTFCGDWLLYISILSKSNKITEINQLLNNFRRHETSVSQTSALKENLFVQEGIKVLHYAINNNLINIEYFSLLKIVNYWTNLLNLSKCDKEIKINNLRVLNKITLFASIFYVRHYLESKIK